ncbi:MAG TPA: glucose 1-dehydrogenase [Rhodopila sp.]|jgi:NAD(P)-dependent dehydrogenase (short-subunit alcohol dehydrogenase family)
MADLFGMSARHALVTGASSGLGRHFAGVLAAAGATVTVGARREAPLQQTVASIRATGAQAHGVRMDVTDAASVEQAFAQAEARFGPVGIVINNAGVTVTRPAIDMTADDWTSVIDTNLKGVWTVAQQAARRMIHHGSGGSIVNIASIVGLRVAGGVATYAVSKAGAVQMTKALALEWARHRIRVNALAPGYIETELNDDFFASEAGKALVRRIPQRRLGELKELDGPLLLLASDAGSYMTGSVLVVDGGHLVSGL